MLTEDDKTVRFAPEAGAFGSPRRDVSVNSEFAIHQYVFHVFVTPVNHQGFLMEDVSRIVVRV